MNGSEHLPEHATADAGSALDVAGTTWRYAMTRELSDDGGHYYTIREVYTGADGSLSWTADAIAARGDSWVECADDLSKMGRALGSPILDLTLDPPAWVSPLGVDQ